MPDRSCLLRRLALGLGALFVGSVVATLPSVLAEDEELPPTTGFFDEYDRNADGQVTRDEFDGGGDTFRLLDRDKDGVIQPRDLGVPDDYRPQPKRRDRAERGSQDAGNAGRGMDRIRRQLKRMDKDGDDRVSRDEWSGREQTFDRLDANKDGYIDAEDAKAARERGGREGRRRRGPDAEKGPTTGSGNAAPAALPNRVGRMDADKDGKVTREEWKGPENLFDSLDKDKDGVLAPADFQRTAPQGEGGDAERRARRFRGALRRFDRDRDGRVSREEFPASDERFDRMDRNGDGFLSEEDLTPAAPKEPAAPTTPPVTVQPDLLKQHDKNGDGKLDRSEWTGSAEEWKRRDKDSDGWLSAEELTD